MVWWFIRRVFREIRETLERLERFPGELDTNHLLFIKFCFLLKNIEQLIKQASFHLTYQYI